MKKIAIATDSGMVAQHFGRCPNYTIFDLDAEKISNKVEIPNPGHSTGFIPKYLHEQNVNVIISGGMGRRAVDLFNQFGIEPIVFIPENPHYPLVDESLLKEVPKGIKIIKFGTHILLVIRKSSVDNTNTYSSTGTLTPCFVNIMVIEIPRNFRAGR